MSTLATLSKPQTEKPIVTPGDRVWYWTSRTGTQPLTGKVCASQLVCGATYAEIEPDLPPHRHVYLFRHAVWGFERVQERLKSN